MTSRNRSLRAERIPSEEADRAASAAVATRTVRQRLHAVLPQAEQRSTTARQTVAMIAGPDARTRTSASTPTTASDQPERRLVRTASSGLRSRS